MTPIQTTRVSQSLQTFAMLQQLSASNLNLFQLQQQLATGKRFASSGEDPLSSSRIVQTTQLSARQDQILTNLKSAEGQLNATDSAIGNLSDLLIEATGVASEQVNSFQSADQRQAAASVIDGILSQLVTVGNQQFQGRYLFGGQHTTTAPFDTSKGFVQFVGDGSDLSARVGAGTTGGFETQLAYNLTGDALFGLNGNVLRASADLNPALTTSTRIADLRGALGMGVRAGAVQFTEKAGPDISFNVDFSGADTVGDAIAAFNQAASDAGTSLTMSLVGDHLQVTSGGGFNIDISDASNGYTATDLGLVAANSPSPMNGADLNPRLTLTTALSALNGGAGFVPGAGVTISNGATTTTVSFTGATTVQDVLNRLNGAGLGLRAQINADGTGIDVFNLTSGTDLTIGENGGTDATALGIRSMNGGTLLSSLNHGRGVGTTSGNDLTITDGNGIAFGVDLDGATTLSDVLAKINAAATTAGSTLTAGMAASGNGIRLSEPAGGAPITVARANLSPAIDDLGLSGGGGTATEFVGSDVAPNESSGVFSALYELRDGLLTNDTQKITSAGEKLTALQTQAAAVRGAVGARSADATQRRQRAEDAVTAMQVQMSDLSDVDYTDALTRFQQAQTALQASLLSSSKWLNLSLLDFLR